MTNNKILDISNAIKHFDTIIIHRHQLPDPDAFGSQMGLAEIIKHSYPKKNVYCVGSHDKSLAWIGKEDQIPNSAYHNALVIVTDTANRPRISDQRFNNGSELIKIDHHPNVDKFGDIQWVNPKASSASEMVFDLCHADSDLHLDDKSARFIYIGMVGDTGRFMYKQADPAHTLYVASQLAKYHFSLSAINQKETQITLPMAQFKSYVINHLTAFKNGTAYFVATQSLLNRFHVDENALVPIVNTLGNIKGITAWMMFTQVKNGYRVSLRSHAPAINGLASEFGGGGHALASGTFIRDRAEIKDMVDRLNTIVTRYNDSKYND